MNRRIMEDTKNDYSESCIEKTVMLNCKDCGSEIYQCVSCQNYFTQDVSIYCCKEKVAHICQDCFDGLAEEED